MNIYIDNITGNLWNILSIFVGFCQLVSYQYVHFFVVLWWTFVYVFFFLVGFIEFGSEITGTDQKLKLLLTSQDEVYHDIRDRHFSNVFSYLSGKAKAIQTGFDVSFTPWFHLHNSLSVLLQLYLHSSLNWPQYIAQRQLQAETRNI